MRSFLARLGPLRLPSSGSCCPPPVGLRSTALAYAERVRTQFLSLRHVGRSRKFSAWVCAQLSPTAAGDFSFELRTPSAAEHAHYSPKSPFISEALDSVVSVRFLKFQRFQGPTNFNQKRFCDSSRTGECIRLQFAISGFESSRPSEAFRGTKKMTSIIAERAANGVFAIRRAVSMLLIYRNEGRLSGKSLANTANIPIFRRVRVAFA
jgi:hypothetical protein